MNFCSFVGVNFLFSFVFDLFDLLFRLKNCWSRHVDGASIFHRFPCQEPVGRLFWHSKFCKIHISLSPLAAEHLNKIQRSTRFTEDSSVLDSRRQNWNINRNRRVLGHLSRKPGSENNLFSRQAIYVLFPSLKVIGRTNKQTKVKKESNKDPFIRPIPP